MADLKRNQYELEAKGRQLLLQHRRALHEELADDTGADGWERLGARDIPILERGSDLEVPGVATNQIVVMLVDLHSLHGYLLDHVRSIFRQDFLNSKCLIENS